MPEDASHPQQEAQQIANEVVEGIKQTAASTQQTFDDGISAATEAVKSGAAQANFQYGRLSERSQRFLETGKAHTQAGLDAAFDTLRDGVHAAMEHPGTTYATGFALAFLILPGTRRLLWRQTIGRLRSEEAMFKSAELKSRHLQETIEGHEAEARKLGERLAAAQEQYAAGLAKLKATNRQLQSLLSNVQSAEGKAASIIEDLRELPSAQALKLRAGVALQKASAQRQSSALERQVYNLSKKGF